MLTKTVRSRFDHEIGGTVAGCTILEKRVIIPPQPSERRLGVYDYVVEVPPTLVEAREPGRAAGRSSSARTKAAKAEKVKAAAAPEKGSYTRSTPDEMTSVIRRVPGR